MKKFLKFELFKIKDNNNDYIDIETDTSISHATLMFYNRCNCRRSTEHYEEHLRRVLMFKHYRIERLGGYRLSADTHRFFNEAIHRERREDTRMSRVAIEI